MIPRTIINSEWELPLFSLEILKISLDSKEAMTESIQPSTNILSSYLPAVALDNK